MCSIAGLPLVGGEFDAADLKLPSLGGILKHYQFECPCGDTRIDVTGDITGGEIASRYLSCFTCERMWYIEAGQGRVTVVETI